MDLKKFLISPKPSRSIILFWWVFALAFTLIYGLQVLPKAFSSEYTIMDDARQHIFWMSRFQDTQLFPHDWIANYYQSISPPLFQAFYHLMAMVGISPLLLNKLLPTLLGLTTIGYYFFFCLEICPIPSLAFVSSLTLSQNLWLNSDLVTAAATGCGYPPFMAFLYYLSRNSLLGVAVSIILLGNIYAPLMLVAVGILGIRLLWQRVPSPLLLTGIGLGLLIILYYLLEPSNFGPTITASQARDMPEFYRGGRTAFFYEDWWDFWLKASRSGVRLGFDPPLTALGLLLPLILGFPRVFPWVEAVTPKVGILWDWLLSSFFLFFSAHFLLFKLYLPSRYTLHSLRMLMPLAGTIVLFALLDLLLRKSKPLLKGILIALIASFLFFYPPLVWREAFPRHNYFVGNSPELYELLQTQPKDIMIASISAEADNIPTFAKRSVLVAWEYALPYAVGYYKEVRQRGMALIKAIYTEDMEDVVRFIDAYGIDFFLIDSTSFTQEYVETNEWLKQWRSILPPIHPRTFALSTKIATCSLWQNDKLILLDAKCI